MAEIREIKRFLIEYKDSPEEDLIRIMHEWVPSCAAHIACAQILRARELKRAAETAEAAAKERTEAKEEARRQHEASMALGAKSLHIGSKTLVWTIIAAVAAIVGAIAAIVGDIPTSKPQPATSALPSPASSPRSIMTKPARPVPASSISTPTATPLASPTPSRSQRLLAPGNP
jgi:hypothetical protein